MTANPQPLFSKIITPARSPQLLSRPRLLDAIHANVDRKLTLISAPAGYGKTSLLTDFAHDTHLPVCWYALDRSDRDPALFLATLVAAIGRHAPDLGRPALAALQEGGRLSLEAAAGALLNELATALADPIVIVLDDYHLVDDEPAIRQTLDTLLRHLPSHCHIILSSRTIPTINIVTLAARRQIGGLVHHGGNPLAVLGGQGTSGVGPLERLCHRPVEVIDEVQDTLTQLLDR